MPEHNSTPQARTDLRAILNRMPAVIGYWNRDLCCEFANQAYIEWFAVEPDRIIGMYMPDLLGEEVFQLNLPYVRQVLAGYPQRFERRLTKVDGTRGVTDARYVPDTDADGVVHGFYVLVTDISELHDSYARNRELTRRLEVVREEERRSMGRALHEGIAQDLFAIKLAVDRLQRGGDDGAGSAETLQELAATVEACMAEARHIADDLRPAALAH